MLKDGQENYAEYSAAARIDVQRTISRIFNSGFFILFAPNELKTSSAILEAAWAIQFRIPSLYLVNCREDLPAFIKRLIVPTTYIHELETVGNGMALLNSDIKLAINAIRWKEVNITV